jgi:hypothetical protein
MSTPAPRKFLNPSGDRYKTPRPTWRRTGPGLQSSQTSSSLRQPPSTQFARTPHFAKPSGDNVDAIDVSFEDRSSLTDAKIRRAGKPLSGDYDHLIDGNDADDVDLRPSERLLVKSTLDHFDTSTARPSKSKDTIQDIYGEEFSQPNSKRLKISCESAETRDAILISSSDSEASDHYDEEHPTSKRPNNSKPKPFSLDSDLSDDDTPSSPTHTRTTTHPRFKAPAPPSTATQQPTKPTFKPLLPSQLTTPLPETFSPSRRRGRRDYIPSGYADTVRSWVLELAAAESRAGHEGKDLKTLRVGDIRHDLEGRCASVLDERGMEWLLVSQGPQNDISTVNIRTGDMVEVNGEGTTLRIALGREGAAEGAKGGVEEGANDRTKEQTGGNVNVSVLWKVKR